MTVQATPVASISDAIILDKWQNAKTKEWAFKQLVCKYQERLYWHVRRMLTTHEDANDVLQNTFIKVFRGLDKFKNQSQLYTWLYRIATNESITFLNKRKRKSSISIDNETLMLKNQLKADNYFDGDDAQLKLQLALKKLPEKQCLVFNMRYFDDMSYKEISNALGTSVGGLKASYHHAVKKIEAFFLDND